MRTILSAILFAALAAAQQAPLKASIEGKVADASGQPTIRVSLSLLRDGVATPLAGRPDAGPTAQSDKDGKFTFTSLDPGRYRVFAEKNGLLRQAYGAKPGSTEGTVLNLTAGETMKDISIEMIPMGSISGRILDDHGDPLRAIVELYRRGYTQGRWGFARVFARSNEPDGSFAIFDLAPGDYYARVSPLNVAVEPGGSTKDGYLGTFYGGATDVNQATPIQVYAGGALTGMDIRVARGPYSRVRGRVEGPNPPQRVILLSKDPLGATVPSSVTVAVDGTFDFPGAPRGEYRLAAMTSLGKGVVESYGWIDLEVGSRAVEGVVLVVQPRFDLPGRVVIAGDDPRAIPSGLGVRLASEVPTNAGSNGPVGVDGSFIVPRVAQVKYQVSLSSIPAGMYLAEMRIGQQDVLSAGLDFTGGGPGDALRITLKRTPGELSGVVQTEDGKTRAGAIVTLVPEPAPLNQSYLFRKATADQNGQFDIKDVAPSEFRAYAWDELPPGAEFDAELLKAFRAHSAAITVVENGRQAVALQLIHTENLPGR
jgi:hypothetical protein